jgi:hypothetical protein
LALYLYRDFGIDPPAEPSASDVVRVFQAEFGYLTLEGEPSDDFKRLYKDDSKSGSTAGLFEDLP